VDRKKLFMYFQHTYWTKVKLEPAVNLFLLFICEDTLKHVYIPINVQEMYSLLYLLL
jgi:hypothetical protein